MDIFQLTISLDNYNWNTRKTPIKEIDLAKIEKEHAEAKLARLTTDHESRVIKLEQVKISFIFHFQYTDNLDINSFVNDKQNTRINGNTRMIRVHF